MPERPASLLLDLGPVLLLLGGSSDTAVHFFFSPCSACSAFGGGGQSVAYPRRSAGVFGWLKSPIYVPGVYITLIKHTSALQSFINISPLLVCQRLGSSPQQFLPPRIEQILYVESSILSFLCFNINFSPFKTSIKSEISLFRIALSWASFAPPGLSPRPAESTPPGLPFPSLPFNAGRRGRGALNSPHRPVFSGEFVGDPPVN